jgi:RNA recognition motif-containing protein
LSFRLLAIILIFVFSLVVQTGRSGVKTVYLSTFQSEGFVGKKLYVGNIPWTATEEEIKSFFAVAGEVKSVSIITDRDTGRSRGFCFVEMETGADEAIQQLNGKEMGGRALKVNEAREREPRSGGGSRSYGGGDGSGGYGRNR